MDLVHFYENEILPILNHPLIFSNLNLKDKGDHYSANCPQCQKHEAFIYKNSDILVCNRKINCTYAVNVLAYLHDGLYPKGKEFVEIVKKLAEMHGVTFPEREYSPQEIEHFENRAKKGKLLEDFLQVTINFLHQLPWGTNAQEYLEGRGWSSLEMIKEYEFGYYPSKDQILAELKKLGHEALKFMIQAFIAKIGTAELPIRGKIDSVKSQVFWHAILRRTKRPRNIST